MTSRFSAREPPPGAEVVAEPIRVASFLHVIHLLEDGGVKLRSIPSQSAFLIGFGKEAIDELHDAIENCDIEADDAPRDQVAEP